MLDLSFFLESCGLEAVSHGGDGVFFLNEEGRKSTVFIYASFSQEGAEHESFSSESG